MSFDKYILSCNHHHKQDIEHFYHPQKFPVLSFFSSLFREFTGIVFATRAERIIVFKWFCLSPTNRDTEYRGLTLGLTPVEFH